MLFMCLSVSVTLRNIAHRYHVGVPERRTTTVIRDSETQLIHWPAFSSRRLITHRSITEAVQGRYRVCRATRTKLWVGRRCSITFRSTHTPSGTNLTRYAPVDSTSSSDTGIGGCRFRPVYVASHFFTTLFQFLRLHHARSGR